MNSHTKPTWHEDTHEDHTTWVTEPAEGDVVWGSAWTTTGGYGWSVHRVGVKGRLEGSSAPLDTAAEAKAAAEAAMVKHAATVTP